MKVCVGFLRTIYLNTFVFAQWLIDAIRWYVSIESVQMTSFTKKKKRHSKLRVEWGKLPKVLNKTQNADLCHFKASSTVRRHSFASQQSISVDRTMFLKTFIQTHVHTIRHGISSDDIISCLQLTHMTSVTLLFLFLFHFFLLE